LQFVLIDVYGSLIIHVEYVLLIVALCLVESALLLSRLHIVWGPD